MKLSEKVIIIAAVAAGLLGIGLVLTFTLPAGTEKKEQSLPPYQAPREAEALVTYVSGHVFLYRGTEWKAVEIGELVRADDYLKTFENSYCDMQIGRRVILTVLENTAVKLSTVLNSGQEGARSETELLFGTLLCKAEKLTGKEAVRVRAGAKAFGVRGTAFLLERRSGRIVCAVKEGRVAVEAPGGGTAEALVAKGQELSIDELSGRAAAAAALSQPRKILLDRLGDVAYLDVDPERSADIVKIGVEVVPSSAEIYVDGKLAGYGSYAGLFMAGTNVSLTLKKNGYKEASYSIPVKRGNNRIYKLPLELDSPERGVSPPGPNEAYELRIKRLEGDVKKAAEEKDALKANVEALEKDKAALSKQLTEANRKIKEAMDKLKQ